MNSKLTIVALAVAMLFSANNLFAQKAVDGKWGHLTGCLLYTSPSPRD